MDRRTTLAELPPRSPRFYVGLFLCGAICIALLEALYAAMPYLNPHTTDGSVAALDLDGEGSLAVYFSSFTLTAAAAVTSLTYVLTSTRRAKRRIWPVAAACWLALGVDECASLHEAFKELMTHATGERLSHDGSMWWVVAYGGLLSTVGLKLVWEMRRCRPALALFFSTAVFYGVAVLAELGWIVAKDMAGVMLEEGCEMLGNLALLTAMAVYCRHAAATPEPRKTQIIYDRFTAGDDIRSRLRVVTKELPQSV